MSFESEQEVVIITLMPEVFYLRCEGLLVLDATKTMVRGRLNWMSFCGLELNDAIPDANTL